MKGFLTIVAAIALGFVAAKGVGLGRDYFDRMPRYVDLSLPADVKPVVLLVRDSCPYCRDLKAWLDERGVEYTAYEVDRSATGRALLRQVGDDRVPITIVGGYRVVGFRPDALQALIGVEAPASD